MVQSFFKWVCLNTAKVLQKYQSGLFQDWVEIWKKMFYRNFLWRHAWHNHLKFMFQLVVPVRVFPAGGMGRNPLPKNHKFAHIVIAPVPFLFFDTQVMLILILIEVHYSKSAVFSFEMSNSLLLRFSSTGKKIPQA